MPRTMSIAGTAARCSIQWCAKAHGYTSRWAPSWMPLLFARRGICLSARRRHGLKSPMHSRNMKNFHRNIRARVSRSTQKEADTFIIEGCRVATAVTGSDCSASRAPMRHFDAILLRHRQAVYPMKENVRTIGRLLRQIPHVKERGAPKGAVQTSYPIRFDPAMGDLCVRATIRVASRGVTHYHTRSFCIARKSRTPRPCAFGARSAGRHAPPPIPLQFRHRQDATPLARDPFCPRRAFLSRRMY